MKDKKIIQNYKLILIGIIFSLICISPTITSAVSVPINYTDKWEYYRYIDLGGCKGGRWFGDFETKTSFTIELKKQFDLIAGNIKTLSQNESSVVATGVELKARNYDVEGSYNYASSDRATPPLDGKTYSREYISEGGDCGGLYVVRDEVRGGITRQAGYTMDNNIGYTLTSSNNDIIDCSSRNLCVTKNNGTATVTVSFTGTGSYYLQRSYDFGNYRKFEYWVQGDRCPVGYTKTNSKSTTDKAYAQQSYCVENDTVWRSANDACGFFNPGKKCFEEIPAYNAWEYTLNPISYTIQVARPNTPPTVTYDKTDTISYTTATANWTYSDPEDIQTYAQVQVATDTGFNNIVFSNAQAGAATNMEISQQSLEASTSYYPRVKVWNNVNGEGEWVYGPEFQTKDYPEPQVSFDLRSGDTNTAFSPNTLTIRTGESVNANWSITDTIGVIDNSCRLITTNKPEGVAADIFGNTTNRGFTGNNIGGQNLPVSTTDQTYRIELKCEGKPAKAPNIRNISAIVNLKVESYPIITSCRVDKNTVRAGQTDVKITAEVGNVSSYSFKIGRKNGDNNPLTGNASTTNLDRTLSYSDIEFGRHNPWVEVTSNGKTAIKQCPSVANLGDSNVREVNP